jgi:hypothetical protein
MNDIQISVKKLSKRNEFYENITIKSYDAQNISQVTEDSFDSGFSLLILPFDSAVHKEYAQNAAGYKKMFMKIECPVPSHFS